MATPIEDEAAEVRRPVGDEELEDFSLSSDDDRGGDGDAASRLDPAMMNELLLVCSNLGMLRVQPDTGVAVLMRGEDCEEWVHDLQRAIRRDHAKHKLVVKQLGKWKILQKKLLPLLVNHQHDWSLVFSILKVLVMLTMKPPRDSTNIAQQLTYLREYKVAFLRQGVVPVLMAILVEPLAKKGTARTPQDYLNMELVLTLLRNLLAIPNEDARFVTSTTSHMSHLQQDLIRMLHEENVYEMILLFAQDIDSAENREWNLLVMEMVDLTLACSTPKALAAYIKLQHSDVAEPGSHEVAAAPTTSASATASVPPRATTGLMDALSTEKRLSQPLRGVAKASNRHSNFGGMMKLVGPTGRASVLTSFTKLGDEQVPQAAKKPVLRKRGGRGSSQPPITQTMDVIEIFAPKQSVDESDRATMAVLVELCDTIINKAYFQLTNSLKGEFRRGSSKLVSTDRLQYFHLVWFITTYHRLKMQALKSDYRHKLKAHDKHKQALLAALDFDTQPPPEPTKPDLNEKAVLSTLDMFSFNFVLQSIETYATGKNYHGMTVSVKLLAEMMTYLSELSSSDDVRFQRIADSLQHKIFYERDFLDRLPVLLKTWSPGLFSTEYVIDVITLTHIVFKILDAQGTIKVLSRRKALLDEKRKEQKRKKTDGDEQDDSEEEEEEEDERRAQLLLEMQRKEADFDVRRYFQSILSFETIKMYCHVLANYRTNSAKVNHYIHSFFYRAKHFRNHKDEEWTMQPMLFNIHVLLLFNKMLQDPAIQNQHDFKGFLDFIRGVVRDFFSLADKNRLLFVETLLRQPYAAKSCLLLQRNYEPLDNMSKSRAEAVALGRQEKLDRISEARRQKKAMDAEDLDGEEEFTFTLNPSDFQVSTLVASDTQAANGDTGAETSANAERPKRRSKAAVDRAKNWTKVEDRFLKKVYMQYRHLPSVFEVISYEDMFQDRDRTPEQIERRVKHLKLHRSTHDSSDSEDDENGDQEASLSANDDEQRAELDDASSNGTTKDWSSEQRLPKGLESDDDGDDDGRTLRHLSGRRRLRRRVRDDDVGDDSDEDLFAATSPVVNGGDQNATDNDQQMSDHSADVNGGPSRPEDAILPTSESTSNAMDTTMGLPNVNDADVTNDMDQSSESSNEGVARSDRKRPRSEQDGVEDETPSRSPVKIARSGGSEVDEGQTMLEDEEVGQEADL